MRRDKLELADDSLFIERIKHTFTAADAELVIRAHAFLSEKACADDSTAHKAAALLIEQDADAITVAAALLTPLLWQECIDISEIRERFGSTVAASIEDLFSPFIPTTDDRQLRNRDIHVILASIGGVPRKSLLFITFRLLALQKALGSSSRDYLDIANVRISEDVLVKVNGKMAALDLTLRDGDSIEVLEDGDQSTGRIHTCTNRGNGFDPAGSIHLFKEDKNGKKLLRNS